MMTLAKPSVALGYAAFFMCAVTCADFDDVLHAPLSVVCDYTAALVLLGGGLMSTKDWLRGRAYQAAGWAFMVSLLFHSLMRDLQDALNHAPDASPANGLIALSTAAYVVIKFALFAFAILGSFTTLRSAE